MVVQTPMDNVKKPTTLMTHAACESKLRSVVRSSMHQFLGHLVALWCAVVYYAQAAHAFVQE